MSKTVNIKRSTVHGTGLVALDIVISSKQGEPPRQWLGGTCGNVLTILSYLGWHSYPIARLDNAPSSKHVKWDMKEWKVCQDFSAMKPVASIPVITQENISDKNGQPRHRFHWKNCPNCGTWLPSYKPVTLDAAEQVKSKVETTDVFFFDRVSPGALELARYFKSTGSVIFFEPSAKGDSAHIHEAITLSDIVKYSVQRFSSIIAGDIRKQRPALEIQTLGNNGLKYRTRRQKKWGHMPALKAMEEVVDTCGCGDWATAGIIQKLFGLGPISLSSLKKDDIEPIMQYGQALAAWNCGFEGARGGMYKMSYDKFQKDINTILAGEPYKPRATKKLNSKSASKGYCPACSAVPT